MAAPDPPPESPAGGLSGPSLPADLAARVEEIVRSAEREAAVISRDLQEHRRAAEAEARRYVEDARRRADDLVAERVRRLREITDDLISRAQETERQFDALISALERAAARVGDPGAATGTPAPPSASSPLAAPGPPSQPAAPEPPAPETAAPEPDPPASQPSRPEGPQAAGAARPPLRTDRIGERSTPDLDAARLVAIEMAVGGRTREEVDEHLRESFRLTETMDMLDDVFGTGDDRPPAWVDP